MSSRAEQTRRGRSAGPILVALALLVALAGWWLARATSARPADASSAAKADAERAPRADAALESERPGEDAPAAANDRAAAVELQAPTSAPNTAPVQHALDVLVTDELGRAVAGVEVTAGQLDETGFQRIVDETMRARTDATGRARVPFEDTAELRPNRAWLDVTSDVEPALAVEPRHRAGETLHFVTPLLGTVVVIVTDVDGAPMRDAAQVFVCGVAAGARGKALWGAFDPTTCARGPLVGDRARFEHVALDCELRIAVRREGSQTDHAFADAAPRPRPAHVEVPVQLSPTMPILTGRVVRPDGAPYAQRTLDAQLRGALIGPRDQLCGRPQTDPNGGFRFELQGSPSATGDVALALLSTEPREHARHEARAQLRLPLANGLVDLGTLVLQPPAVLLAGRVVDARGAPVEGARFELYEPVHLGGSTEPSWWNAIAFADDVRSDANGEFTIHGSSAATKLAVRASASALASPSLEFAPGALGVELALRALGGLRGRVLLDPPSLASACAVRILRDGVADAGYEQREVARELDADGGFAFDGLEPGIWEARVTRRDDREPLAAVEDLRVEAGAVLEDARLNPLDLGGKLRRLRIEVVDSSGAAVERARATFRPTHAETETRWSTCEIAGGALELLVRELPLEMRIEARGYLSVELAAVTGDVRATLGKAPLLRFALADPSKLPGPPIHIAPALVSLDGGAGVEQSVDLYFDARGEIEVHAARLGRHRLRWHVARREQTFGFGTLVDPPQAFEFDVLPGGTSAQIVELDFDAAWMAQQAAALHF
ncbi:MAG: hypothetical protein EPO68_09290 [Planctomycetota bacterium]|nr:MAG: hypothetical protein EPO68_09290 [Planctomycetota bacterium]